MISGQGTSIDWKKEVGSNNDVASTDQAQSAGGSKEEDDPLSDEVFPKDTDEPDPIAHTDSSLDENTAAVPVEQPIEEQPIETSLVAPTSEQVKGWIDDPEEHRSLITIEI